MQKIIISIAIFSICCLSCGKMISKAYGIQELTSFDSTEYELSITALSKKYSYNFENRIASKTDMEKYTKLDTDNRKNLSQPIQMLYFKNGALQSFQANCYAKGGLSKLNWNYDGRFNKFFPKSAVSMDSMNMNYNDIQSLYQLKSNKENVVVLFWTNMLAKLSKAAIDVAMNNVKEHGDPGKTDIVLINTDYFFIEDE